MNDMQDASPMKKADYVYAARCYPALNAQPVFDFITKPKPKMSILGKLGRIKDSRVMLSVAMEICRSRLNVNDAVGLCYRVQGDSRASLVGLQRAIERAITDYQGRHTQLERDDIESVLANLAEQYANVRTFERQTNQH